MAKISSYLLDLALAWEGVFALDLVVAALMVARACREHFHFVGDSPITVVIDHRHDVFGRIVYDGKLPIAAIPIHC